MQVIGFTIGMTLDQANAVAKARGIDCSWRAFPKGIECSPPVGQLSITFSKVTNRVVSIESRFKTAETPEAIAASISHQYQVQPRSRKVRFGATQYAWIINDGDKLDLNLISFGPDQVSVVSLIDMNQFHADWAAEKEGAKRERPIPKF